MDRLEQALFRRIPRIGLGATVGDASLATEFLRPQNGKKVQLIRSRLDDRDIQVSVYGYAPSEREMRAIDNLWKLRGSSNLIFVNSRGEAAPYADLLSRRAAELEVRNEFVPHHAGLSKRSRENIEAALQEQGQAITAICTSTLELGIDVGEIKEVSQVGPPPSVASLMQRFGRSGRRGDPAILKLHIFERKDALCEDLVRTIAMIDLGLSGWSEPPQLAGLHLSTLLQQTLSVLAQTDGVTASIAWDALVRRGPFKSVDRDVFRAVLRDMAASNLITQRPDGVLILGAAGEKLTRHFSFYAAFDTRLEYRLVLGGNTLGKVAVAPFSQPSAGDELLFSGRCWRVVDVNYRQRRLDVVPANAGGIWPVLSSGDTVCDQVRQQMFETYVASSEYPCLDAVASEMLAAARSRFGNLGLATRRFLPCANGGDLFTWRGDRVNETLALWLSHLGVKARHSGISVSVAAPESTLANALTQIAVGDVDEIELARLGRQVQPEKFDRFLGEAMAALGWQSHSVRGCLSTLAKKGHGVHSFRRSSGEFAVPAQWFSSCAFAAQSVPRTDPRLDCSPHVTLARSTPSDLSPKNSAEIRASGRSRHIGSNRARSRSRSASSCRTAWSRAPRISLVGLARDHHDPSGGLY